MTEKNCPGCSRKRIAQLSRIHAEGPSMQQPSFSDPLGIGPAVDREFEAWIGTPHGANQRVRGPYGGVDCVNLMAAIFDRLFRNPEPTLLPEIGMTRSVHDPGAARPIMARMARAFGMRRVYVASVEPGDLYVVRSDPADVGAGEGHVLMQMNDPIRVGHSASPSGPQYTGLVHQPDVISIWRANDREVWQ